MFEDQSNSNIDSSKQDLVSTDPKAPHTQDASTSNEAQESVATSSSSELSVNTADIDIDDLDLETLERLTNPEASDNDIESALESVASSIADHADTDATDSLEPSNEGVADTEPEASSSDKVISFTVDTHNASDKNGDASVSLSSDAVDGLSSDTNVSLSSDAVDGLSSGVSEQADSSTTGVSVNIDLEDQPRIQVFDENDQEISPDEIKYDASSDDSDENTAVYGKDERFADVNAEEAFGLTSDENVEAIIAALEETEAENNSLQMQNQSTMAENDGAFDESESSDTKDSSSLDNNYSSPSLSDTESPSTVEQLVEDNGGHNSQSLDEGNADAYLSNGENGETLSSATDAIFVSAATNDDDSFLSDIESALEDSELFEQELAESVMQESTHAHNYDVTSASLSDNYKISVDSHDHLHEDYEVINPHPAALESAAEAARRFNALADQADGIESSEGENDFSRADEFDDSELEQAVLEQEAADLENLSKEDADAYSAANSVNHEFQSDDEVVMNNNLTPSDEQLTSEQDLQNQKVSDTTSSSASEAATFESSAKSQSYENAAESNSYENAENSATYENASESASYESTNPLSNATDSSFSFATSLKDAQMSTADANNEALSSSAQESQDSAQVQESSDSATSEQLSSDSTLSSTENDLSGSDNSQDEQDDNPFAGLENFDEQEDESFDSDLAAQMAAAQEAMSQQLAKEAADQEIKLVSADKFRNDDVSIMSDAMMMSNEGHTAIQGLEKRQQPPQLPRQNSYITGLSEDELETIRRIKEMNNSKGSSKHKAEQGYGITSGATNSEEHSTVLFGSAAQAASERISQESSVSTNKYDDSLSGVAAPITRESSFASQSDTTQAYAYNDGTVQSADHYDEFSSHDGTYANNNAYSEQQNANTTDFNSSNNTQGQYSYNEYDENEVQAMPAQKAQEEVDDGPVYYVGPKTERVVEEAPVESENIYVGTYADRIAKQKEAEQSARQAAAYDPQSNMGQNADPNYAPQDNNSLADETFAAAQNSNNYVIPGNQEPQYYVGPANPPVEETSSFNDYEPSPYITPGVRTPEELAAEAAAREAAMQAHAQEQARIAEQQRREQEAARMAAMAASNVDEADLAVPAGMGDGGALSMQNSARDQYAGEAYDDGPRYYVGPKEPSQPMQEAQHEAPIYAVGPDHSNAEVEANIQATRSKLLHDRALPPSYLDEDLQNIPASAKSAEDIAYEEALAEAARESMAAPHSQVIENARKLAAEQESRYASKKDVGEGLFAQDSYPVSGETDGADALNKSSSDTLALESSYANGSLEDNDSAELKGYTRNQDSYDEGSYETRSDAEGRLDDDLSNIQGKMRRDENGTANFANLNLQENVGLGMTVFLYLRQLLAAFFTHTNLPVIAPKTATRLGPCYPSSMPVPYLFVGLLSGLVASLAETVINVDTVGTISFIVFLLCTGLTPYRGIYRIISYISRRRHDVVIVAASVTVPMIIFMWLSNILILSVDGIAEATAAYGIVAMLSAASASTLSWNLPQDPMDSSGTMTTKGLLFVIVLSIMASFGIMHYITGLSLIALCVAMRLIFGMLIAGNNGTSHRSYVHALQLLTMFILLFDLIILKSQGYNILSVSSLEFINQLRGAM